MKRSVKIIILVAIVVVIAAMAVYPSLKKRMETKENLATEQQMSTSSSQRKLNVNGQVISYKTLNDTFQAKGRLIPDEEVDLSFETSGKITDIYFKEGSRVRKGDLLARVNDKPLQAELKKLEAQLPLAQERVKRQQALLENDAVSQESFESTSTELDKLLADIELVKANIAQTELHAPFDGEIGLRQVSEGAYVSPTTVIAKLTKLTPLKVEFSVNESQAYDIKPGTPLKFTWGNDKTVYDATVYAVEPRVDETLMTMMVRALYDNPDGKIKAGHSATVEMNLGRYENTIAIPSLAIVAEMGRNMVYVYRNGIAEAKEVKKGLRTEAEVQIIEGLSIGDTLITSGVMQLRDGTPVTLDMIEQ